ncbi:hypothetical protein [Segatella copri]|uniref:hypothetical protein n=1 Tax=Segatella copri TaxID=165179 RepID=UPI001E2E9AC7|nr:hypothetical protein [Segatella copri]
MKKNQIIEAMHNKLYEIDPHAKASFSVLAPEVQHTKEAIGTFLFFSTSQRSLCKITTSIPIH